MTPGLFDQLRRWRAMKVRRQVINRLNGCFDVEEVEWRPPDGSPLRHGVTTVKLPMDGIIGPRTMAYGHWHGEHTSLIHQRLPRDAGQRFFLVDVGANIGLVTRQLVAQNPSMWSGAICFEPEKRNLARLAWNVRSLPNVHIIPNAVSDRDADGLLHVDLGNAGDCSLEDLPTRKRSGVEAQVVPMISGATAFRSISEHRSPGDRVIWKSDTQGHDLTVLASMPAELWPETDVATLELRASSATDEEIDSLLTIASQFPNRSSVKRGERPISIEQLESFCRRRSESEFDLLLYR